MTWKVLATGRTEAPFAEMRRLEGGQMVGIVTVEFFIVHKKSLRNKLGKVKKSKLVASLTKNK